MTQLDRADRVMAVQHAQSDDAQKSSRTWLKRLGWAGFLFFLIKGLLWLIVPAILVWWGSGGD